MLKRSLTFTLVKWKVQYIETLFYYFVKQFDMKFVVCVNVKYFDLCYYMLDILKLTLYYCLVKHFGMIFFLCGLY